MHVKQVGRCVPLVKNVFYSTRTRTRTHTHTHTHTHTQRRKNGDTQAQGITGMWYMFQQLKCEETRNI